MDHHHADIHACLRDVFGLPSFRPHQERAIRAILRGESLLLVRCVVRHPYDIYSYECLPLLGCSIGFGNRIRQVVGVSTSSKAVTWTDTGGVAIDCVDERPDGSFSYLYAMRLVQLVLVWRRAVSDAEISGKWWCQSGVHYTGKSDRTERSSRCH